MTTTERKLTADAARHLRIAAQNLDGAGGDLAGVIDATGLVRTLGGVDVYLALRARRRDLDRSTVDSAVESTDLAVRPAARGCIYLTSGGRIADCLRFADRSSASRVAREHAKVGLEDAEIAAVGEAVLEALAAGPRTTQKLRSMLPDGLVRSLGDAGKKLGISSNLPPSLRRLEFDGRIERTLEDGRLDTERYLWRVPDRNPLDRSPAPRDAIDLFARFAALYFRAAGVSTMRAFAAWLGIPLRDAKAAVAATPLVAVALDGVEDEGLVHEDHRHLLESPPRPEAIALLPFSDNLVALHGGPQYLVASAHHGVEVPVWGRGFGSTLGDVRHAMIRTLVAGERMVGVWELDPETESVEWASFEPLDPRLLKAVEAEAEATAAFLATELGHGRSFSIDSEAKMAKRVDFVRRLRG